ncbi:hypothetical protein [Shouchella lehensis]|uniref:Uncharacterized protein n=1 Tax=Shouchella lehensis TaxID=300825 RepID=A0A4Y7WK85_9BACI|nr:hypothetical protein [Shouchella lehensis]TES48501.1 hypothetical protein E2L03_15455 [Shouchella lehensis]
MKEILNFNYLKKIKGLFPALFNLIANVLRFFGSKLKIILILMLTGDFHFIVFLFFLLNFFLFPFATVVWDDLIDLLLSGNQLLLPLLFVIPWKMFKMIILYMFAIVIAPIGLIYIYISNGYYKKTP